MDICLYICHYSGMKTRGVFVINPFENPNKTTAYRVAGTTLGGVRIRENYKTQPEALARKQQLEIEALNFSPEKRITTTRLTPAQETQLHHGSAPDAPCPTTGNLTRRSWKRFIWPTSA
jgi:hypothetical protein